MQNITLGELSGWLAFAVALFGSFGFFMKPVKKRIDQIEDHEKRLKESEADRNDLHELMRINLTSIKALLKHGIDDGNNKEGMRQASKEIDDYLIRNTRKGER